MSTDPAVPDAAKLARVRDVVLAVGYSSVDLVMDHVGLPFRAAAAALQQLEDDGYLLPTEGVLPRKVHPRHRPDVESA